MEDLADKSISRVTASLFVFCHGIVTLKQYFLKPIVCYLADSMTEMEVLQEYVDNYCWVNGVVPIRLGENMPSRPEKWSELEKKRKINYYQWIPIILLLQSFTFYSSHLLWKIACNYQLGPCSRKIFNKSVRNEIDNPSIISQIRASFKHNHSLTPKWIPLWTLYFACKLYILTNGLLQMCLMQYFLGFSGRFLSFGGNLIYNLSHGRSWEKSLIFPRVSFCYVKGIKTMGGHVNITAQCVLPINMLNEKVFLFLWCWITGVLILQGLSTLRWIVRLFFTGTDKVQQALEAEGVEESNVIEAKALISQFHYDDVFLLHMLSINMANLTISEIFDDIWRHFRKVNPPTSDEEVKESHKIKEVLLGIPEFGLPK